MKFKDDSRNFFVADAGTVISFRPDLIPTNLQIKLHGRDHSLQDLETHPVHSGVAFNPQ
jgi:hypothetical protein